MTKVKFIYADLQKPGDKENTIALTSQGTFQDLKRHGLEFSEGHDYWFWRDNIQDDPLIFKGKVSFNKMLNAWIVDFDPTSVKPLSKSGFAGEHSFRDITGEDAVK